MKTINKLFKSLAVILILVSCKDQDVEPTEQKTLFLRHKGADMPVWVHGNTNSNKIVLYLHGGPGDCAMCYRYYFKELENDMMVAYWDQRVAGASSGKVDSGTLRYDQFSEDAFYVVKLLKQQYPNAQIYLLAHSFGVELAWQFLTTNNNQQMISGLMAVNGMFSYYRWLYHVREWALREAKKQNNAEAERELLANPVTIENTATVNWELIYRWMYKLGGNPVSLYDDKKYLANYAFASPNTALAQFTHSKAYSYYGEVESRLFEKGALLKNIRIPVRLFWGVKDGIVPVEVGRETKQLLTNTSVSTVEFSQSWHEPFITETQEFNNAVRSFVK
ncbi:alpha/beta hydrolase [Runella rosea]|uniref:Alpha/beta hydrolase n=1 Tax=Runella rosea TaxID=2259595 RepID=A0A344TK92_9BACT|nr:alpha/beta hydrolase [Runella rosea]AXE19063.1 alpha/beta hydrolase [Runella rosea]